MNPAGNSMDREISIFRLFPGASFRGAASAAAAAAVEAAAVAAAAAATTVAAAGIGSGFKFLLSSKRARGCRGAAVAQREKRVVARKSGGKSPGRRGRRGEGCRGGCARGGLARVRTRKKNHLHGNSKPGFQSIKGCTHAAAHTERRNK